MDNNENSGVDGEWGQREGEVRKGHTEETISEWQPQHISVQDPSLLKIKTVCVGTQV